MFSPDVENHHEDRVETLNKIQLALLKDYTVAVIIKCKSWNTTRVEHYNDKVCHVVSDLKKSHIKPVRLPNREIIDRRSHVYTSMLMT